jgi:hypothetical protein
MPRCNIVVFDQGKRKERKCLHNRKWGPICSFHARKYVIKIQALWRCYSTKKKINLFKKLPEDTWSVILEYISKRNNELKLLESHERVYLRRISNMYTSYWRTVHATGGYWGTQVALHKCKINRDYFRNLIKTY